MIKVNLSAFSDEAASDIKGQISAMQLNGIKFTELRSISGKNVSEFTFDECKEYLKEFNDNGIKVFSIGSPLGKVDIDTDFDKYLDLVKKVCEIANVFGTDKIRMFSFFKAYEQKEKVFEYLNKMVEVGNSFGVKMCHENEKDIYGDTAERVCEIMDNVKGLKFVYDPANYIQVNEPAQKTLQLFHDKVEYFHIKDVINETGELVPAGYGDGDINSLVSMIDRNVTLTLEPHLAVFDAYAKIDNTEMKHKFKFENNLEAFKFAVDALKDILIKNGFADVNGEFVKGV